MLRALLFVTALCSLTAACGSDDGDAPVQRSRSFGGDRQVTLQVPIGFQEGRTYPLLIVLHGYGANGFLQQGYLKLNGAAESGMLVLAPDGTVDSTGKQFWNADPACCDFGGTGVDDVAYLGGLIDAVAAEWPVDRTRVTVVGHSNGAFMAYRLACDRADVVTAIAGLAGHGPSTACTPARPVQILHMHGNADETVPYESGTFAGVQSPGALESVLQWATRNGCAGAPSTTGRKDLLTGADADETEVTAIGGCPTAGAVELWTMANGGHLPPLNDNFPTELMAWFAAHPRP